MVGHERATRATLEAARAALCLGPDGNPWAGVAALLDAQTLITHALDEVTEVLGPADPARLDSIYEKHGRRAHA